MLSAGSYRANTMSRTILPFTFTSESVSEGHPDKVCDYIADSILDAYLAQDPSSRVACEVLCKGGQVIVAGELTSHARVDHEQVVRAAIREIGHTDPASPFHGDGVRILQFLTQQAAEIAQGVEAAADAASEQGAGDQGILLGSFGELRLTGREQLAQSANRRDGRPGFLFAIGENEESRVGIEGHLEPSLLQEANGFLDSLQDGLGGGFFLGLDRAFELPTAVIETDSIAARSVVQVDRGHDAISRVLEIRTIVPGDLPRWYQPKCQAKAT
jgi:hypothetical protein